MDTDFGLELKANPLFIIDEGDVVYKAILLSMNYYNFTFIIHTVKSHEHTFTTLQSVQHLVHAQTHTDKIVHI